ncbi:uncharacterized protein LOC125857001 [Solanum stenotomum]|uniref:uncharacterized protein LOC125857001 n=1 Tax=Solanum stenotomum TaxID=172797 RepID=UPI0020D09DCE|nr:uncharacterized protein LOC125857001 [Solanum stenotomum]
MPEWKWERITMDFVSGLPRTQRNHDAIWVIVDRLTKSAHFLAITMGYSLERLAELYINEIVRLHGIPVSIISDPDPRFTSRFWGSLQEALGTKLKFSTSFHPQTYGQTEREALYGRKCRTPLCWNEVGERKLVGPEIVQQTEDKVKIIKYRLKLSSDRQKSYVDLKRCDIEYQVGDNLFLKVGPVAYKLALPPELDKIHNVFHVFMPRRYRSDLSHVLPVESIEVNPELTYNEEPILIQAQEVKKLRNKRIHLVKAGQIHCSGSIVAFVHARLTCDDDLVLLQHY